ncbi:MAG: hypothetical protein ABWY14_05185 [Tardiphaga sp.]
MSLATMMVAVPMTAVFAILVILVAIGDFRSIRPKDGRGSSVTRRRAF